MTIYLDTHVAVWLAQGSLERITLKAQSSLQNARLLISPMVILELEYLFECKRTIVPASDIELKLRHELHVEICKSDFPSIMNTAVHEKWTRDPFDRIIVAHAKSNGFATLISADEEIRAHYPRALW